MLSKNVRTKPGGGFFAMMRDDEQYHCHYLGKRLKEWEKSGDIQYQHIKMIEPFVQGGGKEWI